MNMADVAAVFGTLLAMGIAFPGMLAAWWLLFPSAVGRAKQRFTRTPGRCFALGMAIVGVLVVPLGVLFTLPGPGQLIGFIVLLTVLGAATIGAAGIAATMGERLLQRTPTLSPFAAFVRGAIALELAAAFPFVGWFIFIPIALIMSLGATAFALLRWLPALPSPSPTDLNVAPNA
jgi:hypothetical protein